MKKLLITIFTAVVLLTGCAKNEKTEPVFSETEANFVSEKISIVAIGDNLLHMPVVNSGKKDDGSYEYAHLFEKLQPKFKEADLAVIGQETVFAGEHRGYSGYPLFNSPSDMGKSLVNEGFDVVLHASNHILDKHAEGVENTLNFWKDYPEVTVLGINSSHEDKEKADIVEVRGAKLALLNYTYGTNGLTLPSGKEYLVNYIDEEKIKNDVSFSEENADFTIAFMHWGTEYSITPDQSQKELCKMMCEAGVDLIIGSHPHVIEPVEWYSSENGNKMLVYYSLGNYVSRQKEAKNLLGGLADVTLYYDGDKVSIESYSFLPIVTHYNMSSQGFRVYALKDYTDALALQHGVSQYDGAVSVARFKEFLDKVFADYDTSCIDY